MNHIARKYFEKKDYERSDLILKEPEFSKTFFYKDLDGNFVKFNDNKDALENIDSNLIKEASVNLISSIGDYVNCFLDSVSKYTANIFDIFCSCESIIFNNTSVKILYLTFIFGIYSEFLYNYELSSKQPQPETDMESGAETESKMESETDANEDASGEAEADNNQQVNANLKVDRARIIVDIDGEVISLADPDLVYKHEKPLYTVSLKDKNYIFEAVSHSTLGFVLDQEKENFLIHKIHSSSM